MEILNNIKTKAISKIREYILKKIYSFRKPMTNYGIAQNALLKNKFFFKFLATHERDIAREIQTEYIETMSKVYYSYFKDYVGKLSKLVFDELPDRDDLMGCEDSGHAKVARSTSLFHLTKSNAPTMRHRANVFSLGDREALLASQLEMPMLAPHLANKSDQKFSIEVIFRNIQYAFLENACREYLFLSEFFIANSKLSVDLFNTMFSKSLGVLYKYIDDQFANNSYDALALFVCVHLVYRYRLIALQRKITVLNPYWEHVVKTLWPQFEKVFIMHIESVKLCDLQRTAAGIDNRPHYITRRYAEFSAAILIINDTFPDERVVNLLHILQAEVMALIRKMSCHLAKQKDRYIFLINNYDTIMGVYIERKKEDSPEAETVRNELSRKVLEYVEEMLHPHFGGMISFIKECETLVERAETESLKHYESKVGDLIRQFNAGWRKSLEQVSKEIMSSFTNFKNGNNIQQVALTQFVQYYHRFQKLVSQAPFKQNPARSELINIHQLMVEVKKYKNNF